MHCIQAMAENYAAKVQRGGIGFALQLQPRHSRHGTAEKFLAESFADYQKLAALTAPTYHYANSMQTSQRKIPVPGGVKGVGTNYLWSQLVPLYQRELEDFQAKVAQLKENANATQRALTNRRSSRGRRRSSN